MSWLNNFSIADILERYSSHELFKIRNNALLLKSPYQRPICKPKNKLNVLKTPLNLKQLYSEDGLFGHRLLFNIYEQDLLFLPFRKEQQYIEEYKQFYHPEFRSLGQFLKPKLEASLFHFLEVEISVTGAWNKAQLKEYFRSLMVSAPKADMPLCDLLRQSQSPRRAMRNFSIQCAGDFLTEASGMARTVLGNYGPTQSELFKVMVDEYGYGVYNAKHSTLYEKLMQDQGLHSTPQCYWQYYLVSSLLIHNYIHFICSNHYNFFRYLGALFYAEATYSHACRQLSLSVKDIFGADAETKYFDEHAHIDLYHQTMVFEKVISPLIDRYEDVFVIDLIRGYEEFKFIMHLIDADFMAQLEFMDNILSYKKLAQEKLSAIQNNKLTCQTSELAISNETYFSNIYDNDTILQVTSGAIDFEAGFDCAITLHPGDTILIPRGRLNAIIGQNETNKITLYHPMTSETYADCRV